MYLRHAIATAAALCASASMATTTVGGATLIDTATVHAGTVTPTSYLSYVSGGNGLTGTADGSTYAITGHTPTAAMATADHVWLQYDAPILMYSASALNAVIAVPAIDHGWTPGNTGEFWEPFEFVIKGCSAAAASSCVEIGTITDVYKLGVNNSGSMMNGDDWTTRWAFKGSYNYFGVFSGDRLVGGCFSCGEGEIDALASGVVPEPSTYALLAAGLGLVGFMARRRRNA